MKKLVLALALVIMSGAAATAQKFGYINSQELLSIMPEMVKADTALKIYAKDFQSQMESMAKEFDRKSNDYNNLPASTSDAVREAKARELQDLQKRFQEFQQSAEDKVGKKKADLMNPIIEKADKAIKDVAKANNYDYVFDAGAGLLYAKESDNILPLVKTKLGIK